jgi:hypothetical protein
MIGDTPFPCARTRAHLVEIEHERRAFYFRSETIFLPCLASNCSQMTRTPNVALLPMRKNQFMFGRNRTVRKGTLLRRPKKVSSVSPLRWERSLWNTTQVSPCTPVTNSVSLVKIGKERRPLYSWGRNSFWPLSRIALQGVGLKHHTWQSLPMRHKERKFGRNRAVNKCTIHLRPK